MPEKCPETEKCPENHLLLKLIDSEVRRLDDLRVQRSTYRDRLDDAETRRVDEQIDIRSKHRDVLDRMESLHIGALRAADISAAGLANERAVTQATIIAGQLKAIADSLNDRLVRLEASQYERQGRAALSTPIIVGIATVSGGVLGFLIQLVFKTMTRLGG